MRAVRWGLQRTEVAKRKDRTRRTVDGSLPVQSLADLLAGLGTLSAVELRYEQVPGYAVPTLSASSSCSVSSLTRHRR